MPILLFSDVDVCAEWLAARPVPGLAVLATAGASNLEDALRAAAPELVVAEVGSPRFARLNFDAVDVIILDLPIDMLTGSAGRRLAETLGRLAEESLNLVLLGPAVAFAGGVQLDGVHAGLSLVRGTAVLPDVHAVGDLRALLAALSGRSARVLALDAPVGVRYDGASDRISIVGAGSALLVSFVSSPGSEIPTARLHLLTQGMEAGWPD